MTIGDNIKAIRKARNLTQEKLAKEMGISRSYLSDIENNRKNPSTKTLQSLSNKLGVTMAYLTTGKKMLADLTEDEKIEAFKNMRHLFKKNTKDAQEKLKSDIEDLLSRELNFVETVYLVNVLNFLKHSDSEGIKFMASFIRILNSTIGEVIEDDSVTQEETKKFIDDTIKDMREFLEKWFNYKGCE
ncbi:helix-turn-helix domain-containing protein [Virgibacillus sp.]|uniref:helix-turn-helix domain-containing protein n=1 Tax=Virgibacillus sp. TaxID=1872700 RepID=UPI00180BA96E|nr:helix-turn-helix domain-containing protein [Virgibacillus sp.]NWO14666.1 helix-turn-helix transcriptional regulator [Virgibacillus sp.]